jgi:CspA family cold shock protein
LATGVVDKYSEDKGFGFIKQDNGSEVIVYRSSIDVPGYRTLVPGEYVVFEIEKTAKGPTAKKVRRRVPGN